MSKKSSRATSDEERNLFETVLKGAKRLGRTKALAQSPPVKPKPRIAAAAPKRAAYENQSAPAIGGHVAARLRRGRAEPDARLDLHGFREREAHLALERFLIRAQGEDNRLVLVITGKSGVLHANVPRWLVEDTFRKFVVGISEAHIRHGGVGAYYVALRNNKAR